VVGIWPVLAALAEVLGIMGTVPELTILAKANGNSNFRPPDKSGGN